MVCLYQNKHTLMHNRQQPSKPILEKIHLKSLSNSQPGQLSILPNFVKPSASSQQDNKTKNLDDHYIKLKSGLNSRKAISISNIFASSTKESATLPESYPNSLRLSIESIVLGQKLQMNAELLLLSSSNELWPISLHHLNRIERDFSKFSDCYEEMISLTKVFNWEIKEIEEKLVYCSEPDISTETKILSLTDLVNTSITLMELVYQTVFSIASTQPTWQKPPNALLDRKTIISAIDEVELCCVRIREILLRSLPYDQINSEFQSMMLYACSQLSSSLTYLAMCCRTVSANIQINAGDFSNSDNSTFQFNNTNCSAFTTSSSSTSKAKDKTHLFQLAMQSVSKSSQCLLSSVKNYVENPNPENRFITESFTNSVSTAVKAFAAMATSTKFIKSPSALPVSVKFTKNTLFGACMNLISPTVELLLTLQTLYYFSENPNTNTSGQMSSKLLSDSTSFSASSLSTVVPPTTSASSSHIKWNVPPVRSLAYSSNSNLNTFQHSCQRVLHCIDSMKQAVVQLQQTLSLYHTV